MKNEKKTKLSLSKETIKGLAVRSAVKAGAQTDTCYVKTTGACRTGFQSTI